MNHNEQTDDFLSQTLSQVKIIDPRPGYEQRVWARIKENNAIRSNLFLRWSVLVSAASGILIGAGLSLIMAEEVLIKKQATFEISEISGLPSGSFAKSLGNIKIEVEK